jgi:hypothetical protein
MSPTTPPVKQNTLSLLSLDVTPAVCCSVMYVYSLLYSCYMFRRYYLAIFRVLTPEFLHLYYIVLYYIVLYYIVLYYILLYYIILYVALRCVILFRQ